MKNKGFTLIEITAVVLILGVIFLISFPTLHNILKKSDKDQVDVDNKNIIMAAKTYINLHKDDYDFSEGSKQVVYLNDLVKEELVDDDNYSDTNAVICEIQNAMQVCKVDEYKLATKALLSKANVASITAYTEGNTHEMYTFTHDATTQTEALTDYRYIGNNPYNYVTFNNELWRIIGVFTVEDASGNKEQRIKIIRNESIGSYAWDSNNVNEWSTASLQAYLNGDYYNSLSEEAKSMIGDAKYYLGGSAYDSTTHYGTAIDIYGWERGTTVYSGRNTNWIGKIGLMYPSDYAYTYAGGVDNKCYTDTYNCGTSTPTSGWLYKNANQWLISPNSGLSNHAFLVYSSGCVYRSGSSGSVTGTYGARPSAYLISSIQLDKGTGTVDDPYTLKL